MVSIAHILWNRFDFWVDILNWDRTKQPKSELLNLVARVALNELEDPTPKACYFSLPALMPQKDNRTQLCPFVLSPKAASKKISRTTAQFNLCDTLGGLQTVSDAISEAARRYIPSFAIGKKEIKIDDIRANILELFEC
eukprot:TRINITY_DN6202_c0_g1_i1.p1 TRINITY_DN6202_c0_g1~~TRINITY_DN6202_c0_g1_i1.p1  ORF type:complete len:139 (+),score=11.29 TRINITY_DN6202_c0_g1_i1:3-419(+)